MRTALLASLLLAPLATACTDEGAIADDEGPGTTATPAAGCTTDFPGQVVVACDFGPGIHPFAVTDGRVYTVSRLGTYSVLDLAYSTKTRLYRYLFSLTTTELAWGTVVKDGRLYFPGKVLQDGGVMSALLSIDATTPTLDEATVVTWFDRYELHAPMFGDGERLYAESTVHEDFSASSGPVMSIGYDGDGLTPRTQGYAMPIGLVGDTLYYMRARAIERMPKTGGTAEVIATELSDASFYDRAVDAEYAYTTTAAAPYELRRFGANGQSELVVTADRGPGDLPFGPPRDLRRDDDWLYYLQENVGSSYRMLTRVRADGTGEPEGVMSGQDLTPPVFDSAGIYVGYTRGGGDEPIEGVVVQLAK